MPTNKLNHGDILEIPFLKGKVFFAKYFNLQNILLNPSYNDALKIYVGVFEKGSYDTSLIEPVICLLPLLATTNCKRMVKTGEWKIVGNQQFDSEDFEIPSVKSGYPPFIYGFDEIKYDKWKVLENLGDTSKSKIQNYNEDIKNMEWSGAINSERITLKVIIEYCKVFNKDPKSLNLINDWLDEEIYNRSISIPVFIRRKYPSFSVNVLINELLTPITTRL